MRLLIEYSHPAQVHKFKYILKNLMDQNHQVLILSRDKDVMLKLLDDLSLPHVCLSKARSSLFGMAMELITREFKTLWQILRFKPDLLLSAHSIAITHIGWLLRIPCIVHEDTEFGTLQQRLYIPFATKVITSSAYMKDWGDKHIRLDSLEPLAYLHPDHFTPQVSVLNRYGLAPDIPYAVVRFIAWKAAHDIGYVAPTTEERKAIIDALFRTGAVKVILTSENPSEWVDAENVIIPRPDDLHHLLAFCKLCFTEGITVANEAAVLGIPTVLLNPLRGGHTVELERYGLVVRRTTVEQAIVTAIELWNNPETPTQWRQARERLLHNKIDMAKALTELLLELGTKYLPGKQPKAFI